VGVLVVGIWGNIAVGGKARSSVQGYLGGSLMVMAMMFAWDAK
jgi:hypothetical protein